MNCGTKEKPSGHCRYRNHCRACRLDPVQRAGLGMPDVCPHGVTADNIPEPIKYVPEPPVQPPQLPSLAKQASNLAGSIVSHVAGGMKTRTDEEAEALVEQHCKSCEFYIRDSGRCSQCGCYLAIKTTWKSEHCPVGKW